MSYIIYSSSGTVFTTVATGKVNTNTTSLTLVGRNASNYGQYFNQNFVDLLSNFASPSYDPPLNPITGQLWYDTVSRKVKVYDGTTSGFRVVNSPVISNSQPIGQEPGEFWYDPDDESLNFLGEDGQYVSVATFPITDRSGWVHNHQEIYDDTSSTQKVTLLKSYGDVLGAITTSAFTASLQDSAGVFKRANTSSFNLVNGLTVIGSVKATDSVVVGNHLILEGDLLFNINNAPGFFSTLTTLIAQYSSTGTTGSIDTSTFATITYVNTVAASSTGSLASRVTTLETDYSSLSSSVSTKASITYVDTAVSNSTGSLASSLQQLTTNYSNLSSSVTTFATYTNQVINISNSFTSLSSQFTTLSAKFDTLSTGTGATVSYVDSAVASSTGSLASSLQQLQTDFTNEQIKTAGSYTNLLTVISNSTGSFASRVSTLETNYSSLNSAVSGKASISYVDTAVSNSTGSFASSLSSLQASYNNLNNSLTNVANWIDISSNAAITNLNTVIANSTSSLASSVQNLTSSLGTLTTTVTSFSSAINGIQGKYGVSISGGAVTGFELIGGGSSSSFIISANEFKVKTSSGSLQPLSVSGDTVTLQNVNITGTLSGTTGTFAGSISSGDTTDGVEMTPNGMRIYNSGVIRVKIGNLSIL